MPFDRSLGKIFLALLLGFFLVQMAIRFSWHLAEVLLFFFGTMMACLHVRFLLIFVPFFAPLLATVVARWAPAYLKAKDQYVLNFALIAGIVLAMVHYFPSKSAIEQRVAHQFPVHALEYLRAHQVPGRLLNSYGFGGYMIKSGFKTFIDGRAELFEDTGVLGDYVHLTALRPSALYVFQAYGIRSCLLRPDEPLSAVLSYLPDWKKVYSDNVSVLYVKSDPKESARVDTESVREAAR